jgi:DNA-binding MarR family transcriptional regulator
VGLITHEEIELFQFINQTSQSAILGSILRSPGISLSIIADSTGQSRRGAANGTSKLEAKGLVTKVIDGTTSRFYPTRLLQERAEGFYKHSKEFSEYIVRKLEQEGGKSPIVVKKDLDTIILEAGYAQGRFTMEIGINPYMTCIIC